MQGYRGEADECGCAQCRGTDLPEWVRSLESPVGEAV